ncbi:MAG: 3-oxoacyl-[acyl-carrier-protein] reductase [Candidatus Obscuribacterales bacterium]|nr:3-oxoacyl-[acyl-carrier-protein] reductase [Candidatus Obscuribacterales bacterium]HNB24885.1 3-oxoacyl-[acyl-carrier-protein] reductase [Candidatus Melainabacteria bacterium]
MTASVSPEKEGLKNILADRVALVTGSGRGIGKAIATVLAQHGAKIVISDINVETSDGTAEEMVKAGFQAVSCPANVTNTESIDKMVESAMEKFGQIDILVNNAGITRDNLLLKMSEEHWQAVIDTNLTSAFKVTQPIVKIMSKQRYGRIINIASTTGVHGNFGQCNYAAAKAGLIGFTKTVALEYAKRNITCNAVAPGFIDTDMTKALGEKIINSFVEKIPAGRMGTPDDIARAVLFFAGLGDYVTGTVMEVNGGLYT